MTEVEVVVKAASWRETLPGVVEIVEGAGRAALGPMTGDIVVLLDDDDAVADLNRRFRGQARSTNVLSFPAASSAAPHLGDIVLAFGVCAREASEQGKALHAHLSHLVVHGVLHLLGFDHVGDEEAEIMEARERTILSGLGLADPYAGGARDGR